MRNLEIWIAVIARGRSLTSVVVADVGNTAMINTETTDDRLVVSPRVARRLLDTGNTRLYELLAAGELDSYREGRSRKITMESIRRLVRRRLASERPASGKWSISQSGNQ